MCNSSDELPQVAQRLCTWISYMYVESIHPSSNIHTTRRNFETKRACKLSISLEFCCLRRKDFSAAVCLPFYFLPLSLSIQILLRIFAIYPHLTPSCMIKRRVVKNFKKNSKHLNWKLVGEPRGRKWFFQYLTRYSLVRSWNDRHEGDKSILVTRQMAFFGFVQVKYWENEKVTQRTP